MAKADLPPTDCEFHCERCDRLQPCWFHGAGVPVQCSVCGRWVATGKLAEEAEEARAAVGDNSPAARAARVSSMIEADKARRGW